MPRTGVAVGRCQGDDLTGVLENVLDTSKARGLVLTLLLCKWGSCSQELMSPNPAFSSRRGALCVVRCWGMSRSHHHFISRRVSCFLMYQSITAFIVRLPWLSHDPWNLVHHHRATLCHVET